MLLLLQTVTSTSEDVCWNIRNVKLTNFVFKNAFYCHVCHRSLCVQIVKVNSCDHECGRKIDKSKWELESWENPYISTWLAADIAGYFRVTWSKYRLNRNCFILYKAAWNRFQIFVIRAITLLLTLFCQELQTDMHICTIFKHTKKFHLHNNNKGY